MLVDMTLALIVIGCCTPGSVTTTYFHQNSFVSATCLGWSTSECEPVRRKELQTVIYYCSCHANGLLTLLFFHGDLIWFTFTSCYLLFSLLYTPSFSLSLSVSSLHPVIISSAVVPFFPDSPSRSLPSHSNPATLLSPLVYLYTLFFFPPSSPQFSLLQVVKWILLSQSHHGKGRKRKRMEPKVNYKEVGGTLLY